MKHVGNLVLAGIAILIAASSARAHDGYGYRGHYGGGYHAPRPTDGYYGAPRFFRSWHDRVSGYDDPYNFSDYYPFGAAGYLPDAIGPYRENRGYGTEGRGWQIP